MAKHPTPIFRGRIENDRICLERREDFAGLIHKLNGADIDLRLSKHRNSRSISQNSYLWGCVYQVFAEYLGYETEELHEALKFRFLRDREHEVDGLPKSKSTTELSTAEFTEYIEQVRRLAAEHGCVIPGPGEVAP